MSLASPPASADSLPDERIQEDAASWFVRLRGDEVTDAERAAFAAWVDADPRHRREYETFQRMWDASVHLRPVTVEVPKRRRAFRTATGLAGIVMVCGWLGWGWLDGRIATDPGERRHLRLADGSELNIAPNTRLRVRFDLAQRRLELEEGQIAVSVASDSQRPFEVAAGGGLIRDIGTRFGVSADRERTHVVVAEGMVEISLPTMGNSTARLRVGAGEEVEFDDQRASPVRRTDAVASLGWTRGQLVFDATPLVDVAATLNRYRKIPIKLRDPALRHIRISGVFLIDDEVGALRAIERVAPVRFELNATQQAWEAWPAGQAS